MNTPAKSVKHLLILILLASCGQVSKNNVDTVYSSTEALTSTEDIDINQRNIATRICYAYESKGNKFNSSDFLGGSFSFNIENNGCTLGQNYAINSVLVKSTKDSTLRFAYDGSKEFNNFVQTNAQGYLSNVCTKIKNNQTISNTIDKKDVIIQIKFFRDTLDSFMIKYFIRDTKGNVSIDSSEIFKVRTQFNYSNSQILGMDEEYIKQGGCGPSNPKAYSINQKFTAFTAK